MKSPFSTIFKEIRATDLLPMIVFGAATMLDLCLQIRWTEDTTELKFLEYLWHAVYYGLFLGAGVFLLGNRIKWLYIPFWIWVCFVETIEVVSRLHFNRVLDGDWLMIALTSSSAELRHVCGQYPWWQWGLALGSLLLSAALGVGLVSRISFHPSTGSRKIFGLLCLLPFTICRLVLSPVNTVFNRTLYTFLPVDTIHNWHLYSDAAQMARHPRLPPSAHLDVPTGVHPRGVIVIGESATRNNLHVYGYERPTTPNLDNHKNDLILFRNVRATHGTTGKSLRMIFTEATTNAPDKTYSTLAQRFAQAGYRCTLLSNQNRWGRWEGVETLLFSGCAEKLYLPETHSDELLYDDALATPFSERFGNSQVPQICFLHLMGSHAPASYRCPPTRFIYPRYENDIPPGAEASSEKVRTFINDYDNSIAFTDRVLGLLLDIIQSKNDAPAFFIFFSDHGETPRSGSWRDQSSPDLFEIPFIVWFSPSYRAAFPETISHISSLANQPWSADQLLPVFLEIARVSE